MSMVKTRSSRFLAVFLFLGGLLMALGAVTASATEVVVLRSGNAPAGNPDPSITMLVGSGGAPLSPNLFTTADFDSACTGPNAMIALQPISVWAQQLACDPLAQWIGIDAFNTPASVLFCQPFDLQTCCIDHATLTFCWVVDDGLGDYPGAGGPNTDGVYLNGVAVTPSISGGNYATETTMVADVTGLVQCGANRLEVYNRDLGFAVSGVMYSATIEVEGCPTSTEHSTWGSIKSMYR
ncbi:MAG: hypothetical protein ABIK65_05675 [Candidatus Eisenbacteria bacterium]